MPRGVFDRNDQGVLYAQQRQHLMADGECGVNRLKCTQPDRKLAHVYIGDAEFIG
jgi:hypothetical protein